MDPQADASELSPTEALDMQRAAALWQELLGDTLETRPSDVSYRSGRLPPPAQPPDTHARFTRIGLLGRGGMGEVHRALQTGLEREVALKVLRPDRAGSAHARESFLAEAVITGQLEHPNIVPVYALQCLPDGELSLAMKLVGGRSWRAALAGERDGAAGPLSHQRLEHHLGILSQVCNALAFAHSRKIVHLDLKPENIMLGAFGEVLVLDWGLAASYATPRGGQLPHVTDLGQPCGTPAYMPPELALGEGRSVGPRSDVYLLGAILYEILCGQAPHGGNLMAALRRALLDRPVQLEAWVAPELAAVCSRAMQRDPEQRFASVKDLQAALQDYLLHRESYQIAEAAAVLLQSCRAPGSSTRQTRQLYADFSEAVAGFKQAQKLWPANPRAAQGQQEAHAAFGAAALERGDLALAGSQLDCLPQDAYGELRGAWKRAQTRQAASRRTQRRLQQALVAAGLLIIVGLSVGLFWISGQKSEIAQQAAEIKLERDDARERGEIALEALSTLTHEVRAELLIELADSRSQEAGRRLLQGARRYYDGLLAAHVSKHRVSIGAVGVLSRICEIQAEVDGTLESALQTWNQARAIAEELRELQPNDLELSIVLVDTWLLGADLLLRQNRLDEVDLLLRQALQQLQEIDTTRWDTRRGKGVARIELCKLRLLQGRLPDAREHAEAALQLGRELVAEDLADPNDHELLSQALRQVAQACERSGDLRAASRAGVELLARERSRLALDPKSPNLQDGVCSALLREARMRELLGESGASALRTEALDLRRQLYQRAPDSYRRGADLSAALLANCEDALRHGDSERALALSREAVALCRALLARDPNHAEAQAALAEALRLLGDAASATGAFAQAARSFQERLSLSRAIAAIDPNHTDGQQELARALNDVGRALKLQGQFAEAAEVHREALELQRRLADLDPGLDVADRDLLVALARLGDMLQLEGRLVEARAICEECLERSRALFDAQPHSTQARRDLSIAFESLASVLSALGEMADARTLLEEGLLMRREAAALDATDIRALDDLRLALVGIGDLARQQGALERSEELHRESLAVARQLVEAEPDNIRQWRELAASLDRVGDLRLLDGDLPGARELFAEAMLLAEQLLARNPEDFTLRRDLAMAHMNLGLVQLDGGEAAPALESFEQLLLQSQQLFDEQPDSLMLRRDLAAALSCVGDAHMSLGAIESAHHLYAEAWELFTSLVASAPDDLGARRDLAIAGRKLAAALEGRQAWDEASSLYLELLEILQGIHARDPEHLTTRLTLTATWYNLSRVAEAQGRLSEAAQHLKQAIANHAQLVELAASVPGELTALQGELTRLMLQLRQDLVSGAVAPETLEDHWLLAEAYRQQRDWARAVEVLDAAFAREEVIDNPNRLLFAARIASLAGAEAEEAASDYEAQGLEWLGVFLDSFAASIVHVREQELDPASLLEAWRFLRDSDPELAWLRARSGFAELFAVEP